MTRCTKVLVLLVVAAFIVVDTKARRVSSDEKPGRCPEPGIGLCIERCMRDSNCPRDLKCCSNGCGHTCETPVTNIAREATLAVENTEFQKPGRCPSRRPGHSGQCVERCSGDDGCPGNTKCCSNGCGHTCQDPE
ncbi:hypothetical protein R5R35_012378 [Gryllus longicercus]|uniref:WAP domain-containing protein n=1 Tax=Gryllus longicercus TaxID=2509291 RepID=A0AAN9Z742_9ORTH